MKKIFEKEKQRSFICTDNPSYETSVIFRQKLIYIKQYFCEFILNGVIGTWYFFVNECENF